MPEIVPNIMAMADSQPRSQLLKLTALVCSFSCPSTNHDNQISSANDVCFFENGNEMLTASSGRTGRRLKEPTPSGITNLFSLTRTNKKSKAAVNQPSQPKPNLQGQMGDSKNQIETGHDRSKMPIPSVESFQRFPYKLRSGERLNEPNKEIKSVNQQIHSKSANAGCSMVNGNEMLTGDAGRGKSKSLSQPGRRKSLRRRPSLSSSTEKLVTINSIARERRERQLSYFLKDDKLRNEHEATIKKLTSEARERDELCQRLKSTPVSEMFAKSRKLKDEMEMLKKANGLNLIMVNKCQISKKLQDKFREEIEIRENQTQRTVNRLNELRKENQLIKQQTKSNDQNFVSNLF